MIRMPQEACWKTFHGRDQTCYVVMMMMGSYDQIEMVDAVVAQSFDQDTGIGPTINENRASIITHQQS